MVQTQGYDQRTEKRSQSQVSGLLSFQPLSDSDELNAIIAKYEADRNYDFKRNVSLESTAKYYQAEAD